MQSASPWGPRRELNSLVWSVNISGKINPKCLYCSGEVSPILRKGWPLRRRQDEIRKCSVYREDALSTSTITVGVIPMEKEKGAVGLVLSGGNGLFCRSGVPVV